MLSRHADVHAALLDRSTFSSVVGIFPQPADSSVMGAFPPMLITMDPPRHDRLRAVVSRGFTARRVAALDAGIKRVATEFIERLGDRGDSHDFVDDFAAALPVIVIADLLGIPAGDRSRFRQWSNHIVQMDPVHGLTADGFAAVGALYAYFTDVIGERRSSSPKTWIVGAGWAPTPNWSAQRSKSSYGSNRPFRDWCAGSLET